MDLHLPASGPYRDSSWSRGRGSPAVSVRGLRLCRIVPGLCGGAYVPSIFLSSANEFSVALHYALRGRGRKTVIHGREFATYPWRSSRAGSQRGGIPPASATKGVNGAI